MRKTDAPAPDNPLDDYFSALLGSDRPATANPVDWDDLLHSAVRPHVTEADGNASTLLPGFAPLTLQQPGVGSSVQQFTQLLCLLRYLPQLPAGRLRQRLVDCCGSLQRGGGYG